MDLKETLKEAVQFSSKRKADIRLVFAFGLFGLLILVVAGWAGFSDWQSSRAAAAAQTEGRSPIRIPIS